MVDAFKVIPPIEGSKCELLIPRNAAGLCCPHRRLLDK